MRIIVQYPPMYCYRNGDWRVYVDKLDLYFEANDIVGDKRKASILIMAITDEPYKMLADMCSPKEPIDFTYNELIGLMARHYVPQLSVFRERNKFYAAKQDDGGSVKETVTAWLARVRRMASTCQFGDNYDRVVLDRFICGMRPGLVLERLCEEGAADGLTLERAFELAIIKESQQRICVNT